METDKDKAARKEHEKKIFIVPDEKKYYFCKKTNSIKREDIRQAKLYIGDMSLTTKQVKRLARQERKRRIRENKKHER